MENDKLRKQNFQFLNREIATTFDFENLFLQMETEEIFKTYKITYLRIEMYYMFK